MKNPFVRMLVILWIMAYIISLLTLLFTGFAWFVWGTNYWAIGKWGLTIVLASIIVFLVLAAIEIRRAPTVDGEI